MPPLSGDALTAEIRRHQHEKARITKDFEATLRSELIREGISEVIIGVFIVAAYAFLAALLAPEPVISKLAAILIGAGIGIFAIAVAIVVIISSKSTLEAAFRRSRADEMAEDYRHERAVRGE